MLSNFFRINMPYGLAKNKNGEWMAFNRDYMPIGFNDNSKQYELNLNEDIGYPVHTGYNGLNEAVLEMLSSNSSPSERDQMGHITKLWLYDDLSSPIKNGKHWPAYIKKLKTLSKLQRK